MPKIGLETEFPIPRKKHQLVVFLWLMREGPIYGYDLASRFEKVTKGHMRVSYGVVYPFLRRMESRGLVISTKDRSKGRVYYNLTPQGKLTLKQLLSELEQSRQYFDETLLGYLAIYSELFGRKTMNELLKQT